MAGEGVVLDCRSWGGLVTSFFNMTIERGLHGDSCKRGEPFPF